MGAKHGAPRVENIAKNREEVSRINEEGKWLGEVRGMIGRGIIETTPSSIPLTDISLIFCWLSKELSKKMAVEVSIILE
jgi:hypothetical protein